MPNIKTFLSYKIILIMQKTNMYPTLTETKNIYTDQLMNILVPGINQGIGSMYYRAKEIVSEQYSPEENQLLIFQKFLSEINKWDCHRIYYEVDKIKNTNNCIEYFDNLVKAVFNVNAMLLILDNNVTNILDEKFYDNLTNRFVHQCYVECGKLLYVYSYLYNPEDYTNNNIAIKQIENGIIRAIYKCLPNSQILNIFLDKISK